MSNTSRLVHVMIDTETFGISESAKLLSIGAVTFHPDFGTGDEFYEEINLSSSIGRIEASTVKFWFDQAAKGTFPPAFGLVSIWSVIGHLRAFLLRVCDDTPERLVIWANGTDFDIPKLLYTFEQVETLVPWKYSSVRDCRTIFKLFKAYGIKPPELNKHNALADARWQAEYLMSILKNLGEKIDVAEF